MVNTTKPLTNTEFKQDKPKAKVYNLADGNGLYARVDLPPHFDCRFDLSKVHFRRRKWT